MAISRQSPLLSNSDTSPIASSLEWIDGVMFGPVALSLCILAVAFVGFQMLTGRLPLREGLRVVLGCFVLLGAPILAAGFVSSLGQQSASAPAVPEITEAPSPRSDLPPADYDPYAGASLRRE